MRETYDFAKIFKKNKKDAMLVALTSLNLRNIYEDQKLIFDDCIKAMDDIKDPYISKFLEIVNEIDIYDKHIVDTFFQCEKLLSEDIANLNNNKQQDVIKKTIKKTIKKWW